MSTHAFHSMLNTKGYTMTIDPNSLNSSHMFFVVVFCGALGKPANFWQASSDTGIWDTLLSNKTPATEASMSGSQETGESGWYVNDSYTGTSSGVQPWSLDGNGVLTLTATPFNQLGAGAQTALAAPSGTQYVSGQINTAHSYAQSYGYVEFRAEMADVQGAWPALWMLPE